MKIISEASLMWFNPKGEIVEPEEVNTLVYNHIGRTIYK
jgi:hypothetical protein